MAGVTVFYKNSRIAEMTDSGSKTLNTAGKYCEANLQVSYTAPEKPSCKTYDITIAKSGGWVLLTALDDEVIEHINDASLTVSLINMSGYVYEWYSCSIAVASNTPIGSQNANSVPVYGMANRQNSETSQGSGAIYYPPNNTMTSDLYGTLGMFRIDGQNYYFMAGDGFVRGGTYRLTFSW